MPKKNLGEPTRTEVIYIGKQRYQLLAKESREISYLTNSNIKPSTFLQFLIDEYSDKARSQIIKQIKNMNKE